MSSLSSASVITLVKGGSEIGQTTQLIMSKYSKASKFSFSETLNLPICPLQFAALAFITHCRPSSRVWSMVHYHGQEQILRVSEVHVVLNDWVNNLLVLRAEVS